MSLEFGLARSGRPCCAANGISLHSAYDPEKEAERFLDTVTASRKSSAFLLLGPCLDYLTPVLRRRHPSAPIYRANYVAGFEGRETCPADLECPAGAPLEDFLGSVLDEASAAGLTVIEWPPAARAFPEEAGRAAAGLRRALARVSASAATLKASGRRWASNAANSYLLAENVLSLTAGEAPVVVAAAGPSLNAALRSLAPLRSRFFLIAVSSGLAALRAEGLEPDLVVSTDGGTWSRWHLYPLAGRPAPLASPLSALPSASLLGTCPLLLLSQANFPEHELCEDLGGAVVLPSHGTVSGTALWLAGLATRGPVIAAGLDLASLDLLSHARPHGFDTVVTRGEGRLSPALTAYWAREREAAPIEAEEKPWRLSRSLSVYAEALASDAADPLLAGRLYRLFPSPVELPGFEELSGSGLARLLMQGSDAMPRLEPHALPSRTVREERLGLRLAAWKGEAREASRALASGDGLEGEAWGRTREMLMAIDYVDYAAARRALGGGLDASPLAAELERRCLDFLDGLERRLLS